MRTFNIEAYNKSHLVETFTVEAVNYKDAYHEGKRKMKNAYPHISLPIIRVTTK